MSSNSIFTSIESEKRWDLFMEKNFTQTSMRDEEFDDVPCCVFRVPKSTSESKPEAYAPQHIGLGPYHHLRPDLYQWQKRKVVTVKKFLGAKRLASFRSTAKHLCHLESLLRQFYDHYLDLDIGSLKWIMAIDGLFLLVFLKNYSPNQDHDPEIMENLAADILMLENQIPVVLLEILFSRFLDITSGGDKCWLFEKFQVFCQDHSPLELNKHPVIVRDIDKVHLLDHMYYLIVNNVSILDSNLSEIGITRSKLDSVVAGLKISMEKVPWRRIILDPLETKNGSSEEQSWWFVQGFPILPVSLMHAIAGIDFALASGGIREIEFNEEENKLYLPVIRLNATSEVVLRNLLAYEAASAKPGSTLELAQYVEFMCRIIDDSKDVAILKKEKIIVSEFSDEQVASIFNGLRRPMKKY